ncbi:ATP-binding protein [Paracoccus cavernae]|uniref:ATP-binding protein n=1 Tax=Paracoccus cavernae TaxID=1571207 RepID=UPI0035F4A9F7
MKKSLGVLLAFGLAGLQFVAVLAVVFSSYVTSERALIEHARDLLRDVGINTIEHSKGFLSPAQGAAELAARLAQNEVISSDDSQLLEKLLFQQLQITPQFAGVYYGNEAGNFVMVMRNIDGIAKFRTKIITNDGLGRTTELIWRNDDFSVAKHVFDPADSYDPRNRPWYLKAKAELTTIWTDPYIFYSSKQPGITLSAPVASGADGFRGAVGVDIEISMISDFLSRLNIGANGKALIIHSNGDVIAHPNAALIKTQSDDGTLRFANIREIDDPIARVAFGELGYEGKERITKETPSDFIHAGSRYVSTVMPVISEQLPWTIAVYAPEDDFTAVIKRNRTMNIWLAALVAMATGAVGLALADYIYRPVRAFAVRTALVSQGELDPDEPLPKTYKELERANAALVQQIVARREAEHEYGQTFNMASRGMAQTSADTGLIIRANARFREIAGYDAADLEGKTFADLLCPEDVALWHKTSAPDSSDFGRVQELRLVRKDGVILWINVNAFVIRDSRGKPLHAVLTVDDITQSKSSESQIERLNKDLSHLARGNTMGQMAAGLAHELNQPLTAIAQNADTALLVLDQNAQDDRELRDILAEIEQQSLRAGGIIRALRSFIKKDEGARVAFDFPVLLSQTLQLLQAEATDARVTIETEIAGEIPKVLGNRVQIAQVIVNLLRNAIEAIAGAEAEERDIRILVRREGDKLRVSVEDTGPGVDPSINLFSQFETTKPAGMGLGLSICRSIIEANGGELGNEPPQGRGAVFWFTLPVYQFA